MADHHEAAFLSGSSHSSFSSSGSSSCGKISPHPSSLGLRRSTMDLSDLDSSSGLLSQKVSPSRHFSSSSSQMPCSGATTSTKQEPYSARKLPSRQKYEVKPKYHRGIEAIVQDTFLDTLQVIDVTTAFSNLLSKFFDKKKRDGESRSTDDAAHATIKNNERSNDAEETKSDDTYSPCQIHIANTCSDGDWDHFADFQDRIDEEVITFTPFATAQHKSKAKLDTLDEMEEEDECFSF
ncbi:unnamed protein product [Cylindrotheca closterium]|uniref:Uncharacterized protein n=1 Tax=Cylindrotheca closterium TaxID=2856 RepID=A0AAD2CGX0_9STRA|nr:unnamed protein product [Cylindrotheca closterium]